MERCRVNGGASGASMARPFADIEAAGREAWLSESSLAQRTEEQDVPSQRAVRRVWIPKGDGQKRPLGIPTIRDRVVQTAAVIVMEPIFDEDMPPEQQCVPRAGHDVRTPGGA